MQGLLETIQKWHIHPAVDHFTVAILIVAVLADLFASMFSTRLWLRYAALALIIAGTAAAWGSKRHRRMGGRSRMEGGPGRRWSGVRHPSSFMPSWAMTGCRGSSWSWPYGASGSSSSALWPASRGLYLLFAVLAAVAISYQGYLGGELVYDYGIGTALFNAESSSPSPQPEATGPATPIPTVYVPTATVTPEAAVPTTAASTSATASAMPSAAASAPATPSAASATPSAAPSPAAPPSASATPASSASKTDEHRERRRSL